MHYTISVQRDGQLSTQEGIIGDKDTVIENLLESRKLRDLEYEQQDAIRGDLQRFGHARHDIYTYTLVELPWCERGIKPCSSGFGMYELEFPGDYWADDDDLLSAMRDGCLDSGYRLLELGKDELPAGVADIRGRIQHEPERIFAIVDDDDGLIRYTSIDNELD